MYDHAGIRQCSALLRPDRWARLRKKFADRCVTPPRSCPVARSGKTNNSRSDDNRRPRPPLGRPHPVRRTDAGVGRFARTIQHSRALGSSSSTAACPTYWDTSVGWVNPFRRTCRRRLRPSAITVPSSSHRPGPRSSRQDRERKQDFEAAVRTYHAVLATYAENAYDVIEIPRVTVEERVRFVLDYIGPDSNP